jgi:hypothetical protein
MTHVEEKEVMERLREVLADIEHARWSGWQEYLHSKCTRNTDGSLTIPAGYAVNLERLIKTPYSGLTEKERESDRAEVDKYLPIILSELKSAEERVLGRVELDGEQLEKVKADFKFNHLFLGSLIEYINLPCNLKRILRLKGGE